MASGTHFVYILNKTTPRRMQPFTLPKTNIAPEHRPLGKGDSYWKPPFSGAMLVSGRVKLDMLEIFGDFQVGWSIQKWIFLISVLQEPGDSKPVVHMEEQSLHQTLVQAFRWDPGMTGMACIY